MIKCIENLSDGLIYTLPPHSNCIILFVVTPHVKHWTTKLLPKKHKSRRKDTQGISQLQYRMMCKYMVGGNTQECHPECQSVNKNVQEEAMISQTKSEKSWSGEGRARETFSNWGNCKLPRSRRAESSVHY